MDSRIAVFLLVLLLTGCGLSSQRASIESPAGETEVYEIITLLPRDAIPSIDHPQYYSSTEADLEYDPDEQVLGFELEGETRAYPIGLLSSHEIVNDEIAGHPVAITW